MKNTLDLTKVAFLATIAGIFAAASAHADDKTNYMAQGQSLFAIRIQNSKFKNAADSAS